MSPTLAVLADEFPVARGPDAARTVRHPQQRRCCPPGLERFAANPDHPGPGGSAPSSTGAIVVIARPAGPLA
ncbi:MAG: hypothetical protein J0I49_23025 [Pseudonocardia sp.]|nr:hypothetical protein [Pseudonocardia sp.]